MWQYCFSAEKEQAAAAHQGMVLLVAFLTATRCFKIYTHDIRSFLSTGSARHWIYHRQRVPREEKGWRECTGVDNDGCGF